VVAGPEGPIPVRVGEWIVLVRGRYIAVSDEEFHTLYAPAPEEEPEPTVEGWYRTQGGADWMLYSLYQGQWYAHILNGETVACEWGYIDQAGPVWLIAAYPAP
jgi:hypothetical protein